MIDTNDGFAPLLARRVRDNPSGLFARYEGAPITFAELDRWRAPWRCGCAALG
jgi:hypothetical protein